MIDKLKNIFQNKDKKKENLISLLIILVITLIIINRIWNGNGIKTKEELKEDAYLATIKSEDISDVNLKIDENESVNRIKSNDLEERLKKILETLKGVSNVSVMLTYNESSCQVPIYNIKCSVKTDKVPSNITLVPSGDELAFEYNNGRAEFIVPVVDIHQMVEIS